MSGNSATCVLEDGQNRAFEDGRTGAPDPRPPLAATTAAHDGDFSEVPGTGHGGPVAEPRTEFDRITGGDLVQRIGPRHGNRQFSSDMRGLGRVVNRTACQLPLLTGEVTRGSREAGTEDRPGGRPDVRAPQASC
ncbi:hypothetical protein ACFVTC_07615 [Streptomyces sp. NPDC057950]|uniref:hypothetical protein n=1 Tax=Streptomyces sp. NPDC057950 TaxID=3346288 RepID=UPI0036ED8390